MPRKWTEFSERQEEIREVEAFVSMLQKPEEIDIWWGACEEIRSLPVKVRFQLLEQEYPGEFRLCSEDTCRTIVHNDDGSTTVTESIVPVEHSHEHECVNHDEEDCSWIHPIEIKRSSMMLEENDSIHQANESAGGDYVRYWDDLYLNFPPGEEDEWSNYTYAKSRTVTRQTGPSRKRIMKEEFTLRETLPNDSYGVYGVDRVNYELSTDKASEQAPKASPIRSKSGFAKLIG